MVRPTYETAEDKKKERQALEEFIQGSREINKLPKSYFIDFALFQCGKLSSMIEVKCRNNPHDKYPSFAISMNKFFHCKSYEKHMNIPCFILVKWNNNRFGLFQPSMVMFPQGNERGDDWKHVAGIRWGGRKDRNDWQDEEPMVLIPNSQITLYDNNLKLICQAKYPPFQDEPYA